MKLTRPIILTLILAVGFYFISDIYSRSRDRRDQAALDRAERAEEQAAVLKERLAEVEKLSAKVDTVIVHRDRFIDLNARLSDSLSKVAQTLADSLTKTLATASDSAWFKVHLIDVEAIGTLRQALDTSRENTKVALGDRDRWKAQAERADTVVDSLRVSNEDLTDALKAHQCRLLNPVPCLGKALVVAATVTVAVVVIKRLSDQVVETPILRYRDVIRAEDSPVLSDTHLILVH